LESSAVIVASAPARRNTARGFVPGALEAFGHLVASHTAIQLASPVLDVKHVELSAKDGNVTATTSFVHDALGRLSSASQTGGTAPFNQQFTYDPLGNISTITNVGGSATTNTTLTYMTTDRDRLCRIAFGTDTGTACNVSYDEIGAMTPEPTRTDLRNYTYFVDGSVRIATEDHGPRLISATTHSVRSRSSTSPVAPPMTDAMIATTGPSSPSATSPSVAHPRKFDYATS
jgi:YD repeat-containing protein